MNDQQWRAHEAAENRVWNAWYAALIAGIGTLLLTFWFGRAGPADSPGTVLFSLDGFLTLVLGWLTQRFRSRFASALLTFRALAAGLGLLSNGVVIGGLVSLGIFLPVYFLGWRGTIELRRIRVAEHSPQSGIAART